MKQESSRLFAVVPAAGLSRRMGEPKLLLPFGDSTVIGKLLSALEHPSIVTKCVIIRRDDTQLKVAVEASGGWCVSPSTDPTEMKRSVQFGIDEIRRRFSPARSDAWILVPADYPALDAALMGQMIANWFARNSTILVPRYGQRRGHPLFLRWSLVDELDQIPIDRGLDWLVQQHADVVDELAVECESVLTDIDTPDDYARLTRTFKDRM